MVSYERLDDPLENLNLGQHVADIEAVSLQNRWLLNIYHVRYWTHIANSIHNNMRVSPYIVVLTDFVYPGVLDLVSILGMRYGVLIIIYTPAYAYPSSVHCAILLVYVDIYACYGFFGMQPLYHQVQLSACVMQIYMAYFLLTVWLTPSQSARARVSLWSILTRWPTWPTCSNSSGGLHAKPYLHS